MNTGGLSEAGLGRLHDVLADRVERGAVPGLVALLRRRGEVRAEVIGDMAFGGGPVRRDTIFRISSMTKPITAAAAMILVEECRLRLDEPVDRLLPELADRRVLTRLDGPLADTVPAHRPITARDLLTNRMGMGLLPPGPFPVLAAIAELDVVGFGPPRPAAPHEPDEWLRRLARLPLMHQPGERWMYNVSSEVLGVLVARAAGQPLDAFLRERIFEPLGMADTGFSVPGGDLDRLATGYATDPGTGRLAVLDPADGQWSRPPAFPSGGAGLVSTADDLLAFGELMLNSGRHNGKRILSRPTVAAMTTDQLTPAQKAASSWPGDFFDRFGWGFGMAVQTRRDSVFATPGRFGWDGGLGTSWYVDPAEDLVGILLTQCAWTSPQPPDLTVDFWTAAYQAIDD